ncbi:MAG: hypothetical protein LiPW30_649 [Parcubacteria group bacterium LiPW_30]|nr:MAG: hypothetical protein LiPW30_649 [Parcubacteria group bacterium LiPW_30]
MTTSVRTQSITGGQIGQINDRLATKLRESGLPLEAVQNVLKMPGNMAFDEMVAVFRKHVEAQNDIIVRRVRVDRTRTPMEAINATGRNKYLSDDTVASMPQGEGDEVDVYFIPTRRFVPAKEVPAFLAQYGLVSDPRAQAAVNEADPAFADEHPNGTQWGNNCCLAFSRWFSKRSVLCDRDDCVWHDGWFLSGVPVSGK